jgi:hypothetical protein
MLPRMSPRSKLRALRAALIGCALAGSLTGPVPSAHAAETGVNVAPTSGDYFTSAPVQSAITKLHPAWVRVFIGWNAVERANGVYNSAMLRNYHLFFARLPPGTRVMLDILGTPAWAAGGATNIATPPRDNQYFARFVNYLATAFRGQVSAYEIGEEEDTAAYWTGTPAQYADLLKAAYPAIKSADPQATVIVGGLAGNDFQFVSQLYAAGARGSFDAVAVHTDTACDVTAPTVFAFDRGTRTINRYYFLGFTSVHATMAANGDGAKPIYMSEIGWSSTTVACRTGAWAGQKPAGVSQAIQASFLAQAYRCLAQPRYGYVRAALWFGLYDNGTSPGMNDNYGLLSASLNPKPAYDAFMHLPGARDLRHGGCGNRDGPALRVTSPRAGQRYHKALVVKVLARARSAPIAYIELHVGRRHVLNFRLRPAAARGEIRWYGASKLSRGRHMITLIAKAADGTTSSESVSVYRR